MIKKIMAEYPKISIVTPSLNQDAFLEETIQSVLGQNYPNLEYFVIDGGSSDNSADIIKKYSDRLTFWQSKQDEGQSDAINQGFSRATGDIFAWINSDDAYYPQVLTSIADAFNRNKDADIIYGVNDDIDHNGRIIRFGVHWPFINHAFRVGFMFSQPTSFWRRRVWEDCGPLDVKLNYCMDYDFFCRAYKKNYKFTSIPLRVCRFRYHSSSKSVIAQPKFAEERQLLLYMHFPKQYNQEYKKILSRIEYTGWLAARKFFRLASFYKKAISKNKESGN
jgi:glycosyltransferase involved in cell wall biosynthesis